MLTGSLELLARKALCACVAFRFDLLGWSVFREGAWLSAQHQQLIQNSFAHVARSASRVKTTCASLSASPRAGSQSPARSRVAGHSTGRDSWCRGADTAVPAPASQGCAGCKCGCSLSAVLTRHHTAGKLLRSLPSAAECATRDRTCVSQVVIRCLAPRGENRKKPY